MYHGQIFNREATLEECKMMGAMYVQASVDSLNNRFSYLLVFNTSKLFGPKYYPSDEDVHITMLEEWLERLIIKFGLTEAKSYASRVKLLEFVETLRHECETNHCLRYDNFVEALSSGIPIGYTS